MAKDKLTQYDSTASNNTDVGGISVAEGMLPSGVNNAIREQMSHLADFAAGTSGVDVLKLQDDTDTNSIKVQAPASVTTTTTFTLPDGDGTNGQALITDGSGTLSWTTISGGISDVVDDTTPQLGGDLDLNSNNITGTGYIDISGKVATDTIEHSTAGSVATNYLVKGSAKAWVYYDNLGSNVTRGSFSISSVTDNGVGDATVTISNAMTDAFSCIAGLTGYSTSDPSTRFMSGCIPSTTTVRLESIKTNSDNTDQNCNHMCIIGDLA